jgi:hypothetical protein
MLFYFNCQGMSAQFFRTLLEDFIKVEQFSRSFSSSRQTLSGMYVFLSETVQSPDFHFSPRALQSRQPQDLRDRIAELFKLLIDEGDAHYHRFLEVQKQLYQAIPDPEQWSHTLSAKSTAETNVAEKELRLVYSEIIQSMEASFQGSGDVDGRRLRRTMQLMPRLNSLAFSLAEANVKFQFDSLARPERLL